MLINQKGVCCLNKKKYILVITFIIIHIKCCNIGNSHKSYSKPVLKTYSERMHTLWVYMHLTSLVLHCSAYIAYNSLIFKYLKVN